MKFTKMHGCGNDYVYVNCFEETVKNPEEAAKIVSDRHYGIGSDGLILICPSDKADFRMAMYNLDGSEGKMCGNGVRCIAKYVYDHHLTDKTRISLETLGGIKYLDLNIKNGKVETVVVDMGEPVLTPEDIPVAVSGNQAVNIPLEVDGKVWYMTCISMGNPHAVVFVDNTKDLDLEKIGPKFEKHPIFPEQVNTEFVHVIDRHTVDMRVWERGSGETLACGTGACATAMACILNHMTDDEVLIHLLGGDLLIRYDRETNHIFMTGPAAEVFSGEIDL
ncbi:MAG: diaminopimelate epimerase [Frisingicoccus sp.]|uniref:diaminopimelate epimerase n=1 Tax=Frisingicoccus sp. TaxID=1918627 RepID=UPI0026270E39|nr:diaminopimelate epimerase [Frisingicoccus sp.]MDD6232157.1 diaminopimelate epimerase [Frisingicoccus sp.]